MRRRGQGSTFELPNLSRPARSACRSAGSEWAPPDHARRSGGIQRGHRSDSSTVVLLPRQRSVEVWQRAVERRHDGDAAPALGRPPAAVGAASRHCGHTRRSTSFTRKRGYEGSSVSCCRAATVAQARQRLCHSTQLGNLDAQIAPMRTVGCSAKWKEK